MYTKIKKSDASIKSLIMNQKIVVGIGNIYANEVLFYHGLIPEKKANTLQEKMHLKLRNTQKAILRKSNWMQAVQHYKIFFLPSGNKGYFKVDLNVYDREGEKCFWLLKLNKKNWAKPEVNISL